MAMLSRVAEATYWIGRYVERAENTARLIDVSLRSTRELIGSYQQGADAPAELSLVLVAAGLHDEYARRHGAITEDGLATFLVTDRENASSVVSCLTLARNNARCVREAISSEMWEELNRAYLSVHRVTSAYLLIEGLHDFCRQIRLASQLFQGVTHATMPRDEGWRFLQAGKYLERASMTARIVHAGANDIDLNAGRASPERVHRWLALLRSVSAYEAYVRLVPGGVQPITVAEFLLFSPDFPRSVAFGIDRVREEMAAIDRGLGIERQDGPAAEAALLAARLADISPAEFGPEGMSQFLRLVEHHCNTIGDEIRRAYFENISARLTAVPS